MHQLGWVMETAAVWVKGWAGSREMAAGMEQRGKKGWGCLKWGFERLAGQGWGCCGALGWQQEGCLCWVEMGWGYCLVWGLRRQVGRLAVQGWGCCEVGGWQGEWGRWAEVVWGCWVVVRGWG